MAKALTEQISHAGSTLTRYGWDSGTGIFYHFDQNGFRYSGKAESKNASPEILFFGGSTSFGVGVNYEDTYSAIVSRDLGKKFYNLSYAQHLYNNALIYATACYAFQTYGNKPMVCQWVSDQRTPETLITVYDYIKRLNAMYPVCAHLMIDGLEVDLQDTNKTFMLVNPPWMDSVANNTHPGPRTHQGIAKFLIKRLAAHVS